MPPTEKIRNVGPKSAAWLRQVGIRTHEELRVLGSVEAYRRVKIAGFKPTLNLLYAMAGAEDDCHWTALTDERKVALVAAAEVIDQEMAARKTSKRLGQVYIGGGAAMVDRALSFAEPADTSAPTSGSGDEE